MSEKIVLIDGHSILNRAYYGVPDLTNSEGLHTNAIYGFLNIMFKILEEEKPEFLTVAFDLSAPTFRHKMFAEYKGTRKPMQEELRQQVPVMKEVLKAMGVKIIEMEGYEADDLLGTIARISEEEGKEVRIISGDRDLLQLATEHVMIRIPKTKKGGTEIENYFAEDVKARYLVTPKEFIDVKALMGDSSDNIPGVPFIGEKTATALIEKYGSIENCKEHAEELKPPRASKAMQEHYDLAVMSKELAEICVTAPVDFEMKEARIGDLYTPEAYTMFQKLQFKNLLARFDNPSTENDVEDAFQIIKTEKELGKIGTLIKKKIEEHALKQIGVAIAKQDKDVLPLFAMEAGIGYVGIALSKEEVYCFEMSDKLSLTSVLELLDTCISQAERVSVHNLKQTLKEIAIPQEKGFDPIIGAYLLNPLNNSYGCDDVAREYLNLMLDVQMETSKSICYEAYVAYASVAPLLDALKEKGMAELFAKIEMPLVYTLNAMEVAGVKVEGSHLKEYSEKLAIQIEGLEKEIYELAGETFNINSPKQLGVVLFENMELPGSKKTKTGYSTAADVLEKLAPDYPIVDKILEYRQLSKLKSTYADGLVPCIQEDGRIHGTFNQTITATGRISSTEPNLQNIPIRMELGRLIRKVFVPQEGCVFIDADYSQIELRILAHCSGDENLLLAFKKHQDIHRTTASQVFHVPFDEVTDLQRRNAKAVNFGIVYGISAFGLSQDIHVSRKEAQEYIDQYFETYPKVKAFLDDMVEQGKELGYVKTIFGRIRPIPELSSSNFMQRSFGERIAMNSPIQGAAADIMKIAMIRVDQALREEQLKSRVVLQVHDELLVETYLEEQSQVEEILKKEMESAADLLVDLEVDMHSGKNWYEAK